MSIKDAPKEDPEDLTTEEVLQAGESGVDLTASEKRVTLHRDEIQQASARAQACSLRVGEVLEEFHCRIQPVVNVEMIGDYRDKILTTASYGIVPLSVT